MTNFDHLQATESEVRATFRDFPGWGFEASIKLTALGPVVAGLRVMPYEVEVDEEDRSLLEIRPSKTLPPAGLPARALRQINLGDVVAEARRAAATVVDSWDDGLGQIVGESLSGQLRRAEEIAGADHRRPGRPCHPDSFYAEWARRYVAKVDSGVTRPIVALAIEWGEPRTWIRDTINKARDKGFLTSAGTIGAPGRAGGRLTTKAKKVLAKTEGN